MSLTQSQTGILTVNGTFRETLSGDGRSNGESLTFNNTALLANANLDGWFQGTGTISATTKYHLDLGNTAANVMSVGTGAFNLGFTSNGKYVPFVYLEMLTNSTGPGSAGKNLQIYQYLVSAPTVPTDFLGIITNPGDFWCNYASNSSTPVASGTPSYTIYLDGTASITFKLVVGYRTNQYPA